MGGRRKIITRVIAFLLLMVGGAIVNVAVAWGCAIWIDPMGPSSLGAAEVVREQPQLIIRAVSSPASPGSQYVCVFFSDGDQIHGRKSLREWSPRWAGLHARLDSILASAPDGTPLLIDGRGWPMLGMVSIARRKHPDLTSPFDRGIPIPLDDRITGYYFSFPRALPLRPIWPGFAINTLFYAGILWLIFAAPFALRRRRRIKRGLCSACAYPIGDSPVCTECGKPLPRLNSRGHAPHGNLSTAGSLSHRK